MAVASGTSKTTARQPAMAFIMIAVFIDMLAIGIMVPVLPALVGSFTSSKDEQAFWFAAVMFAFGLANFFGSPLLGALSDRFGRRPVLLLGFCGLALNFFATALATAVWVLVAVRFIGGALQANAAVANAYVADITAPEDRAKRFGLIGSMFGLGFILGPAFGGLLGGINLQLPFFVAGGLALLNLIYGCFVLPESLPLELRRAFSWTAANPLTALKALIRLRGIGKLVLVVVFTGLAQGILYSTWVLYGSFKFGWGPQENGWSLAAVGVMSVLVQGWLLSKLLKRFSAQRLAVLGLLSSVLAHVLWGLATEGWMMFVIIAANVLGFTVTACLQSVFSSAADAKSQGQTLGTITGINAFTAVFAPLVGAPVLGVLSQLPHGHWALGAPMYLCAALQACALMLAWKHFKTAASRAN